MFYHFLGMSVGPEDPQPDILLCAKKARCATVHTLSYGLLQRKKCTEVENQDSI